MSTAITGSAPTSTAPITTDSPTPPQPTTTTLWPCCTAAVFVTAPTPVATPQPISAPSSAGSLPSTRTAPDAGTTARWPNEPTARYDRTGSPVSLRSRVPPSGIRLELARVFRHTQGRPPRQRAHSPQGAYQHSTTRSPGANWCTSSPTDSTTPQPSWPSTIGGRSLHSPSITCRSEWHSPEASIRTASSPGPGSSSSSVSSCSGRSTPMYTAARSDVTTAPRAGSAAARCRCEAPRCWCDAARTRARPRTT